MTESTANNTIYNHLQNDLIKFNNTSYVNNNNTVVTKLGSIFYYATHATPLLGAFVPKAGLSLRLITDVSEFFTLKDLQHGHQLSESVVKSIFSGLSTYCIFFAPLYSRHVEAVHSLVMHARDLAKMDPKESGLQPALHLFIDLLNLAVVLSGGVELQLASLFLQVCVGLLDSKKEWDEKSYLGTALFLALSVVRLNNLANLGREWYQTSAPQPQTLLRNTCAGTVPEIARLHQPGTGSTELGKLSVIKYLGREPLSGDLFLVRDEDGTIKVLKRLFSAVDKIETSSAYAFVSILFFPFTLLSAVVDTPLDRAKTALKISRLNDPHICHIFKIIENRYKTGEHSLTDTYLLMEYVEGTYLDKWKGAVSIEMARNIAVALANVANSLRYFYASSNLSAIKVSENLVKFVSFDNFLKATDTFSCLTNYKNLYTFFANLIALLPEKEKWMQELNRIFNLLELAKSYTQAEKGQFKNIFTPELLKSVLNQVAALFTERAPL